LSKWKLVKINEVTLYVEGAVKYTQDVDSLVRLYKISNAVMAIKYDANFAGLLGLVRVS